MLFNSFEFVIFFASVFAVYWALPFRLQNWLLLLVSYLFYGWWGYFSDELHGIEKFLPLILLVTSTVATHICAKLLHAQPEESRKRSIIFWIGIVINVGMLGYFKYRGFFAENLVAAFANFNVHISPFVHDFMLPAGISFYTFQGLSYLIDVNGGSEEPAKKFTDFALFHSYFPQLVAGPIERTRSLLPQLTSPRKLTPENLWSGLQLIVIGYVKKVAIADSIAPVTAQIFNQDDPHTGLSLLLGLYLFALQIYGDFSGYSDIARGTSRLLGVELMINFRQPYFSRNITEFWERWHISLSTWLRDYVFVPLCRKFRGKKWIYFNLMLTMIASGLWHGASWNFVFWGIVLGLLLVGHKLWSGPKASKHPKRPKSIKEWLQQIGGMILTFHCVCLTLIFVKTEDLAHSGEFLKGIYTGSSHASDLITLVYLLFYMAVVLALDFPCWWKDRERPVSDTASPWKRGLVFGLLLLLLAFVGEMEGVSFVYFQF